MTGVDTFTLDTTVYENITNKQNSLAVDGFGVKYPTIDIINKVVNYITPEQFGAIGDGITDDTTSIQNAINSLSNGGIIKFANKTYICGNLELLSNIILSGNGNTILKFKSGSQYLLSINSGSGGATSIADNKKKHSQFGSIYNAEFENHSINRIEKRIEELKSEQSLPTQEVKPEQPSKTKIEPTVSEAPESKTEKPSQVSENEPTQPPAEPPKGEGGEGTGITHAQTAETRKQFSFEEYEKKPETFEEWDAKADERIAKGEMPALIKKMQEGRTPSDVEQRMMGKYIAELAKKAEENPSDENLNTLHEAIVLSDFLFHPPLTC